MGPIGNQLSRIVLHSCVDGVPAFDKQNCKNVGSVKPIQYFVGNLAPWLRYKKRYMLLHALIPSHLKGAAAKKYYDWIGTNEMTPLYRDGVGGVKVIMYGNTNDTPGRRELLNMQAVTAFYPCPHCLHSWQPGLRGQTYGGYRRFLPQGSAWRNKTFRFMGLRYEFRDEETRAPPLLRNDKNVALMAARGTLRRPFMGHKGVSFFSTWEGVDWAGNFCDKMHDVKLLCEMTLKGLVGTGSSNGMYKEWATKKRDTCHREDCKAYGIFHAFHSSENTPPPWRLSKEDLQICDMRVRSMWWPHYMDPLSYAGHSFWTHPDRIWKCKHKHYAMLVILPTCLRGFVKEVHTALLMLTSALRRLGGQVICVEEARRRGIVPGFSAV